MCDVSLAGDFLGSVKKSARSMWNGQSDCL
jgi:hypothetical protein